MRRMIWILAVGTLVLLSAGCATFGTNSNTNVYVPDSDKMFLVVGDNKAADAEGKLIDLNSENFKGYWIMTGVAADDLMDKCERLARIETQAKKNGWVLTE